MGLTRSKELKRSVLSRGAATLARRASILRSKGFKAPRKPINAKSEKQAAYDAEYDAIRPFILQRDHHRCRVGSGVCTGSAEHVHHRLFRSHGGSNRANNLVSVCRNCHNFVHSNHDWAVEMGFILEPQPNKVD